MRLPESPKEPIARGFITKVDPRTRTISMHYDGPDTEEARKLDAVLVGMQGAGVDLFLNGDFPAFKDMAALINEGIRRSMDRMVKSDQEHIERRKEIDRKYGYDT